MTSLELRAKRAGIIDNARKFYDEHQEDGHMSAEDAATFDRMCQEAEDLKAQIDRAERIENMSRELSEPTSTPLSGRPENAGRAVKPRASKEYRDAFWASIRDRALPHETRNVLQIGADSEGGVFCPDEYENTLIDALADVNVMRQLGTIIKSDSGERRIPIVASHGTANWMNEGDAYTDSDDEFDVITLGAHKLGTTIKVSEELLNDSVFNLETYIAAEFGRRMGRAEEAAFIAGTGSGQPRGLLSATGGAQTGITTASITAITADELLDLFYSLRAPYRKNASFLMNDMTVKAIRKLKGTDGQYIWQPSLQANTPDLLLGRPVHTSEDMPTIEAGARAIAFGDFKYYWISDRQGRSFKRLNELYAKNGQIGFQTSQRVDGRLTLPEAVKLLVMKAS